LRPGHDADFVVWDPDATFTLTPGMIRHKHKVTPYEGKTLRGVVHATFVRGQNVYQINEKPGTPRPCHGLHITAK
jgi:allantoinase